MFTLTLHAMSQAETKGLRIADVLNAANNPTITYANGRYAGQMRHIRGDIVAVVDVRAQRVITVYANVVETDLRSDQTDRDAQRYGRRRKR